MVDIQNIKKYSIADYLERAGISLIRKGNKCFCSSPFSSDSNPSFAIYPSNTFFDWSTGRHGDIIDLVMNMEDINFVDACKKITDGDTAKLPVIESKVEVNTFHLAKWVNERECEIESIEQYAKLRGIETGFIPAKFYYIKEYWERMPSVGFVHTDYNGEVCGIKMRAIDPLYRDRFSARGKLKYYVLDNEFNTTDAANSRVFVVESESSANSLYMLLVAYDISGAVISFGGVANIPARLPFLYEGASSKFLIIDYDGNEELYKQRLQNYSKLNLTHINLRLPKGEDINSLYTNNNHSPILTAIHNEIS